MFRKLTAIFTATISIAVGVGQNAANSTEYLVDINIYSNYDDVGVASYTFGSTSCFQAVHLNGAMMIDLSSRFRNLDRMWELRHERMSRIPQRLGDRVDQFRNQIQQIACFGGSLEDVVLDDRELTSYLGRLYNYGQRERYIGYDPNESMNEFILRRALYLIEYEIEHLDLQCNIAETMMDDFISSMRGSSADQPIFALRSARRSAATDCGHLSDIGSSSELRFTAPPQAGRHFDPSIDGAQQIRLKAVGRIPDPELYRLDPIGRGRDWNHLYRSIILVEPIAIE
ncbi:MAG: hypothetical protein ACFB01_14770 [Cohaesibacteraceae bacterium]